MNLLAFLPILAFCGALFFIIAMNRGRKPVSNSFQFGFTAVAAILIWGLILWKGLQYVRGKPTGWSPFMWGLFVVVAVTQSVSLRKLWPAYQQERAKSLLSRKARPFFWQGVLILLPLCVLVVAGVLSIRWDRAGAEAAAKDTARQLALQLSDHFSKHNFSGYRFAREEWEEALQMAARGAQGLQAVPEEYWGAVFREQPLGQARLDLRGDWMHPVPMELPQPNHWQAGFTADQDQLWSEANRINSDHSGRGAELLRQLLATKLTPTAAANIRFQLLQLETESMDAAAATQAWMKASFPEDALSEAGVPLQDLQLIKVMRDLPAEGIPKQIHALLVSRILGQTRSILVPELLREARRIAGSDIQSSQIVGALDQLWAGEERTQRLMEQFLATHSFASWKEGSGYWSEMDGERYLLALEKQMVTSALMPRAGWVVYTYPETVISRFLADLPGLAKVTIPLYARASVRFADVRLPVGDQKASMPLDAQTLAEFEIPTSGTGTRWLPPSRMEIVLADADLLYAEHRRRALWAMALISLAAVAAMVGFVSSHRAFRRQLRLAEMKDDFVSSVSHELRAPLASVRLLAESLEREKVTEPGNQKEYFKLIGQECRRLSSLVENVLDFSRIEQGRKHYEFESLDLQRLLEDTIKSMQPYAAEKSVALCLRNEVDALVQPVWDGRAIQQALINLIDNAVKHSPAGQSVTIEAKPADADIVRLSVNDYGPGIPKEEQAKIFEKFYRLGSELRRETQGIGIGLSIVQHIAEAHGGRVLVKSEEGQGSAFTLELQTKM